MKKIRFILKGEKSPYFACTVEGDSWDEIVKNAKKEMDDWVKTRKGWESACTKKAM